MRKAVRDVIAISKAAVRTESRLEKDTESMDAEELKKLSKELEKKMRRAAAELDFENAAVLRDRMVEVNKLLQQM